MTAKIIDFQNTPKEAFKRGFWKGLGAPVILFGEFGMDVPADAFRPQDLPKRRVGDARSDMQAVADDMWKAFSDYGQQTTTK